VRDRAQDTGNRNREKYIWEQDTGIREKDIIRGQDREKNIFRTRGTGYRDQKLLCTKE